MLIWDFDGRGEWAATSSLDVMYVYRTVVCDDGTFDVSESSKELIPARETFHGASINIPTFKSLAEAKAFCQADEDRHYTSRAVVAVAVHGEDLLMAEDDLGSMMSDNDFDGLG